MDTNSAINSLKLYNEKADKLEKLSFSESLRKNTGFRIEFKKGSPLRYERFGPSQEAIDAFVLTVRFFIQDNENSSFRNIANHYSNLSVSQKIKDDFNDYRGVINEYLDSKSFYNINDKQPTQREIFEVFLWGGLAHANREKKIIFDDWASNNLIFSMFEDEFVTTLIKMLATILCIREINKKAIKELGDLVENASH